MSKLKTKVEELSVPEVDDYIISLDDWKAREKFIKRIEKIVRSSMEYKDYIQFLKENMDFKKCAFFNAVDGNIKGIRVELHHEPFTLFDIVNVVIQKHLEMGVVLNDLLIADEVIDIHYRNMVGLIPLSKTVHQVITKNIRVTVPLFMVSGDYAKFIDEYYDYILKVDDLEKKIENKILATKSINESSYDMFDVEFVYFNVEGMKLVEIIPIRSDENGGDNNVNREQNKRVG